MRKLAFGLASTLFLMIVGAVPALADEICFLSSTGIKYRLGYEARSSTYDVNGVIVYTSGERIPVTGSATVTTINTIIIGLSEVFPFVDGGWSAPAGSTTLRFVNGNLNTGTRVTTYHGNGTPSDTTATVTLVNCSTVATTPEYPATSGVDNIK